MALSELCSNVSLLHQGAAGVENVSAVNGSDVETTKRDPGLEDRDRHALLYIVVTLLFYSLGIIIGIITYLKREKEEIEEDKRYEDYMTFRNDPDKWARYFRVQRMVSQLNRVEQVKDERKLEAKRLQEARRMEKAEEASSSCTDSAKKSLRLSLSGPKSPQREVHVVVEPCADLNLSASLCSKFPSAHVLACGDDNMGPQPHKKYVTRMTSL